MTDPSRTTRAGEVLVTLTEAAEKLSVPIGTLYSWRSRRQITPVAVAPGGTGLYRLVTLEERARTTRRRRRGAANG